MLKIQDTKEYRSYPTKVLWKRFLPYFRPYRGTLFLDLFCAGLTTAADIVLPMILRSITNTGLYNIELLTVSFLLKMAALYFGLRVVDTVANFYMTNQGHVMGAKIETDMRRAAYRHLQELSVSYYNKTKVGQIMGRITNDLFDVTEFAHHCPEEFFIAGVKGVASFVILSFINLPLTLMVFAAFPVMLFVSIKLNGWQRKAFRRQRQQIGELNARVEDSLLGQRVVKAFANEELEEEKFDRDNQKFLGIKKDTYLYMGVFRVSTLVFEGLMYLIVILGGGFFLYYRQITPGDLVAYVMYVTTLIATIRRIVEFAEQFQRGMTGIERFLSIMDADIEIFDKEDAIEMKDPKGEIIFKDVSFEYTDDNTKVFHHLNLSIHHGEKVALVGPSGGGKTTLCNLIPRFFDITGGSLTIDGIEVSDYTLKSLRKNIGIVQQDVYLFSGTIFENIVYGRPGASRHDVELAARLAGAEDFINNLPNGLDTYVGERGVRLSGGQKQRISIARVFLKDPKIIILDEATSALDNESEFEVAHALAVLSEGRTTLTVAHRLSTIRDSDRIFVLTEDGIVEEGNHEELLKKDGIYCRFYRMAERIK